MADDNSEEPKVEEEKKTGEEPSHEENLDLDDDLADALSDGEAGGDGSEGGTGSESIDVDQLISEVDPSFSVEMDTIASSDFDGVIIEKDKVADEVDEESKVPSAFKAFLNNLPEERKKRYIMAMATIAVLMPFAALVFMGKILPRFDLPYTLSMDQLTKEVVTYPSDGVQVPLFDEFRTKAFTVALPQTTINLQVDGDRPAYGQFEFFLSLRDKELTSAIKNKQSEIIDLIQRVLEQVTWKELQTPIGKEKVKKVIKHRLNEYLQGNVVIGVYYR